MLQWADKTMEYKQNNVEIPRDYVKHVCGTFKYYAIDTDKVEMISCDIKTSKFALCYFDRLNVKQSVHTDSLVDIAVPKLTSEFDGDNCVQCLDGHIIHKFLACHSSSGCLPEDDTACKIQEMFDCGDGRDVPYNSVCDHKQDCGTGNDENFCQFKPCDIGYFDCGFGEVSDNLSQNKIMRVCTISTQEK